MPQKTRSAKHAREVGCGGEGGGDRAIMEYIMWDKTLADTDYMEELVKSKLISESAAL